MCHLWLLVRKSKLVNRTVSQRVIITRNLRHELHHGFNRFVTQVYIPLILCRITGIIIILTCLGTRGSAGWRRQPPCLEHPSPLSPTDYIIRSLHGYLAPTKRISRGIQYDEFTLGGYYSGKCRLAPLAGLLAGQAGSKGRRRRLSSCC